MLKTKDPDYRNGSAWKTLVEKPDDLGFILRTYIKVDGENRPSKVTL